MTNLNDRLARASELRRQGYNCAQTVLMTFDDATGLDQATAARIAAGLGTGVGAMGEICGVPNAIAIVEGLTGGAAPADKKTATARTKAVISRFAENNGGCITCRQLKRPGASKPCDTLIAEGITLLHNSLQNSEL